MTSAENEIWTDLLIRNIKQVEQLKDSGSMSGHTASLFVHPGTGRAYCCIIATGSEEQVRMFARLCDRASDGVASTTGENKN